MSSTDADTRLYPIDEVARRLQLRPSAIRYYEDRGLIKATARRGESGTLAQINYAAWR